MRDLHFGLSRDREKSVSIMNERRPPRANWLICQKITARAASARFHNHRDDFSRDYGGLELGRACKQGFMNELRFFL